MYAACKRFSCKSIQYNIHTNLFISTMIIKIRTQVLHTLSVLIKAYRNGPEGDNFDFFFFFFNILTHKTKEVLYDIVNHCRSLSLLGELSFKRPHYSPVRMQMDGSFLPKVDETVPLWSLIKAFQSKFQHVDLHMVKYPINPSDHAWCRYQKRQSQAFVLNMFGVKKKQFAKLPEHFPHWLWSLWMLMF